MGWGSQQGFRKDTSHCCEKLRPGEQPQASQARVGASLHTQVSEQDPGQWCEVHSRPSRPRRTRSKGQRGELRQKPSDMGVIHRGGCSWAAGRGTEKDGRVTWSNRREARHQSDSPFPVSCKDPASSRSHALSPELVSSFSFCFCVSVCPLLVFTCVFLDTLFFKQTIQS